MSGKNAKCRSRIEPGWHRAGSQCLQNQLPEILIACKFLGSTPVP